jgi:hypothetical protein
MQTYPAIMNDSLSKEYTIVRLSKNNLIDLALLHAEVYHSSLSVQYFLSKYDTAYTGVEYTGFIAYNKENVPIAYYGVIPCLLKYGNEIILAAQSADTMTHPKFRYKGMFVELSNITFDLCKQMGIQLIFGFPNQNSYHGAINKLGWRETETMDCFTIPVKALPIQSISQKFKLGRIYTQYCEAITKKYGVKANGVSNSVINDGFAGVYRNENYLSHKKYSGTKVLGFKNSQVWISRTGGLIIGDMQNINEANFNEVINHLKTLSSKLGLKYVQFHCSPGTGLHTLFSGCSVISKSFPVLFQNFNCPIPLDKIKFVFADIDIF